MPNNFIPHKLFWQGSQKSQSHWLITYLQTTMNITVLILVNINTFISDHLPQFLIFEGLQVPTKKSLPLALETTKTSVIK